MPEEISYKRTARSFAQRLQEVPKNVSYSVLNNKRIETKKANSTGLLEIRNTTVNHLLKVNGNELPKDVSKDNRLKENSNTTIKDLIEVVAPDSWIKWNMTKLVEEPRLNIIFDKGYLVIQSLRDSVCYVVDLSGVPKCGSFNPYGNEQMGNTATISENSSKEDVKTFFTQFGNGFFSEFADLYEDMDGKHVIGKTTKELLKTRAINKSLEEKATILHSIVHPNDLEKAFFEKEFLDSVIISFFKYLYSTSTTIGDLVKFGDEVLHGAMNEAKDGGYGLTSTDIGKLISFIKENRPMELDISEKDLKKRKLEEDKDLQARIAKEVESQMKKFKSDGKSPGSTTFAEFVKKNAVKGHLKIVEFESFSFTCPNPLPALETFCHLNSIPDPSDPEERYQNYFISQLGQLIFENRHMDFKDTHRDPYLDGRKPDLSCVVAGKEPSPVDVVSVGELKTRKFPNKETLPITTDSSLGEIITFTHRVIEGSPNRKVCFGFITDCEKIYFIKTTYDPSQPKEDIYSYDQTPVYDMAGNGRRYLYTLLFQSIDTLGWCNEFQSETNKYEVESKLGKGLTSVVWKSGDRAVKHYSVNYRHTKELESSNLEILAHIDGVPTLIDKGADFIVMTPVGTALSNNWMESQIRSLFTTLQAVHARGLVHRDLRLSNIATYLRNQQAEALILDWGFAVKAGEEVDYRGSLHFAHEEVLNSPNFPKVTSLPKHDLCMLVKVFHSMILNTGDALNAFGQDRKKISSYWNSIIMPDSLWKNLLRRCESLDYSFISSELCKNFSKI